jgi:hypothetical protein
MTAEQLEAFKNKMRAVGLFVDDGKPIKHPDPLIIAEVLKVDYLRLMR